ncbi:MAG TPA: S-layer homology domain-containing protein [Symbiobacteriaceae bacterium]
MPPGPFLSVAHAAAAFPISQSFTGASASGWRLGGTASLGTGWLRLTSAANNEAGFALYGQPFDSNLGIVVDFDYAAWGGTGADGTAFFLIDGSTDPNTFQVGAYGGSLGYANNDVAPGATGAYVGIGLDEYGNFSNPTGGRTGGPGFQPNYVVIRGRAADNYNYLTSAASSGVLGDRNAGRHVRMYITPDKKITVQIQQSSGQPFSTVINQYQLAAVPPATLMLGFAASTGGSTNYHEVRNLNIAVPASVDTTTTSPQSNQTVSPGQTVTYTVTVNNSGQNAVNPATTTFVPGSGLTNLTWTCATGGASGTCAAASGDSTSLTPTENLPVGGSVVYTVTANVGNPPAGPVTFKAYTNIPNSQTNVSANQSSTASSNLAPVAQDMSVSFSAGTAKTFTLSASDPDGDTLTASQVSAPSHGGVGFSGLSATYTPNPGYSGTDSFTYHVSDGQTTSNTATVTMSSPTLSGLAVSNGTLSPGFSPTTNSYTVSVSSTVTSETVTPATTSAGATIQVNGNAVTSGSASASIPLSVGNTVIPVTVTTTDGNTGNYTITVNRAAPAVSISAPSNNGFVATSRPAITGTADVGLTLNLHVDGNPSIPVAIDGTGHWSYTPPSALADGSHTVQAIVTAGDGASGSSQVSFTVDTTAPVAALTAPATGTWVHRTITITGTANDANLTSWTLARSPAGANTWTQVATGVANVTANTLGSVDTTALTDGDYDLRLTVTDKAGNVARATNTVHVKNTPPALTPGSSTSGLTNNRRQTLSGTTDPGSTVTIVLDSGAPVVATVGANGAWSYTPVADLSDGVHTIAITATDQAGNATTAPVRNLTVDATPPSVSAARTPANQNGWNNGPVTVTFSCSDSLSGMADCSGPITVAKEGANSVSGGGSDRAGNSGGTTVSGINIDLTPPTITGNGPSGWSNGPVTVAFTCSDALSGVAACAQPVRLGSDGANQSAGGTATDKAGNTSQATVSGINIDSVPPVITGKVDRQPDQNGWYTRPVTVRFTCSDSLAGIATCPAPVTLSGDGVDQKATGTAVDKAGNKATASVGGINTDTTPPSGTIQVGDGEGVAGELAQSLILSATDNGSGVAAMRFSSDGTTWTAWKPYTTLAQFVLPDQDGTYTIAVEYQDRAGNVSSPISASVKLDRLKPQGTVHIIGVDGGPSNPLLKLAVSVQPHPNARPDSSPPQVRFAVDGGAWSEWQDVSSPMWVPLTPGDGLKMVGVQFGGKSTARSDIQTLQFQLTYRSGGETCLVCNFPVQSGQVGTYYYDAGVDQLVRLGTIYNQGTGRTVAVARHSSPGFYLTLPEPVVSFPDIDDSLAKNEILALAQMNIVHGYSDGTFRPHQNITRAEAAKIITLAAQVDDVGATGFPDIAGHWAERIIKRAAQARVVSGYPNGLFMPNRTVTRAEFVKMLAAPFELPLRPQGSINVFTDLDGHWAQEIVESAVAASVLTPGGDTFRPDDPITREDAAKMLFKAVNRLYDQLLRNCAGR